MYERERPPSGRTRHLQRVSTLWLASGAWRNPFKRLLRNTRHGRFSLSLSLSRSLALLPLLPAVCRPLSLSFSRLLACLLARSRSIAPAQCLPTSRLPTNPFYRRVASRRGAPSFLCFDRSPPAQGARAIGREDRSTEKAREWREARFTWDAVGFRHSLRPIILSIYTRDVPRRLSVIQSVSRVSRREVNVSRKRLARIRHLRSPLNAP